jgi:hypothetical protein
MSSRAKRILTDLKFSRTEAARARAEAVDPAGLPDLAGPVDPADLVDRAVPVGQVDLIADAVGQVAVRRREVARRQASVVLRLQETTSASSCSRFASANPGRFRSSPSAS